MSGEWIISRQMTKQKEEEGVRRRKKIRKKIKIREEIGKGNQMTALRF